MASQLSVILAWSTLLLSPEVLAEAPPPYRVEPAHPPSADLSGEIGQRLLRLLDIQVRKSLKWVDQEQQRAGLADGSFVISDTGAKDITGEYNLYQAMSSAYALAILARCGEPGRTMGGATRETLEHTGVALVRAVAQTHPISGGKHTHPEWWPKEWALRVDHVFGMGAWLLWDKLDPHTQLLVARILEHDADLYNQDAAPAKLQDDTQAESNAWTAGGLAVAYCMLKHHPHRAIWGEKAKEFMLSAYATADDVASSRVVDGKPLNQWLKAPNLFPDYTLENHGFVHADYMAAVSEMVRSAITYRLAGEPVPDAATFNADKVFDQVMFMTLPAGHYLYVQGTDYFSRRLDSFFEVCSLVPFKPDPLRNACFLRSLTSIEKMAAERPDLPMSGWEGMKLDFGTIWGLTENYLMRRLFGTGGPALPADQVDAKLAGVRVSQWGKFAIHRTAEAISSFSWHTSAKASQIMGLTMPLGRDALCYPMPGSYIGDIRESAPDATTQKQPMTKVRLENVNPSVDGFGVLLELERCGGKVVQRCAFVSLPDGSSVYIEERTAAQRITIAAATSGNVVICDDVRWVYQARPRTFQGSAGLLTPSASKLIDSNWINVDDQLGFIAIGRTPLRLFKVPGTPSVWRGTGTMYDMCHVEFVETASDGDRPTGPQAYDTGQRIGLFAMVTCPGQSAKATASLAAQITATGWHTDADGLLALRVGQYLVYANFAQDKRTISSTTGPAELAPQTAGWIPVAVASRPAR